MYIITKIIKVNYFNNLIMTTCSICCDIMDEAKAKLKCGHEFCTECLLNQIAKTTGTEEGTTRNKCPLCRTTMCDNIEPDYKFTYVLNQWKIENETLQNTIKNQYYSNELNTKIFLNYDNIMVVY